jgi:hypothetical protein
MSIGNRLFFRKTANETVAASTTLIDCAGLAVAFTAGQIGHIRLVLPFTLGATGGYKFQIITPAAPVAFRNFFVVTDGVTASPGAIIAGYQTSSAAFANALAVAGTHKLECEFDFENGTTAGNVQLQFACNSAANSIIALAGGYMDVIKIN